jgi:dienelactone hydrolase
LINHTIYMPLQPTRGESLPVLLWSEGGCANDGKAFVEFLTNIASYGFIVLANGPPGGAGSTTAQYVKDAAQWISAKAGTCGRYHHVDADRMAAAGQSCGGLETYQMRDEENIRTLGIFNSGFVPGDRGPLPNDTIVEGPDTIKKVHKPVFYFLGGSTDVAYPNVSVFSCVQCWTTLWVGMRANSGWSTG